MGWKLPSCVLHASWNLSCIFIVQGSVKNLWQILLRFVGFLLSIIFFSWIFPPWIPAALATPNSSHRHSKPTKLLFSLNFSCPALWFEGKRGKAMNVVLTISHSFMEPWSTNSLPFQPTLGAGAHWCPRQCFIFCPWFIRFSTRETSLI